MMRARYWHALISLLAAAACGPRSHQGEGAAQATPPHEDSEGLTVSTAREAEVDLGARSAPGTFSLPASACDDPVVVYRARGVVTIKGADSGNRVDVITQGPDASAQKACELALGAHGLTGDLGQRVVRACSPDPIAGDPATGGWDLVSPVVLEGVALRMRVGWPEEWELAECTQTAMVYMSNHASERACAEVVNTMDAARTRADEAGHRAARTFLSEELERAEEATQEKCRLLPETQRECAALGEVAKHVNLVCEKPASKGCTRAKEATLLLEACNLSLQQRDRDCEAGKILVQMLQERIETPPEASTDPVPFCRPAAR